MIEEPLPYLPPQWDIADVTAIQACVAGKASRDQQKRAMTFIVYDICLTDDVEYRTNERSHCFMSGRAFVGKQINKMISINTMKFIEEQTGEE